MTLMTSQATATLTAERVASVFRDCLFGPCEDPIVHITVESITRGTCRFNRERTEAHRDEIRTMLKNLPASFQGRFDSFQQAMKDNTDTAWTSSPLIVEQLVCLGLATGMVRLDGTNRQAWRMMPGGLPLFSVTAR